MREDFGAAGGQHRGVRVEAEEEPEGGGDGVAEDGDGGGGDDLRVVGGLEGARGVVGVDGRGEALRREVLGGGEVGFEGAGEVAVRGDAGGDEGAEAFCHLGNAGEKFPAGEKSAG